MKLFISYCLNINSFSDAFEPHSTSSHSSPGPPKMESQVPPSVIVSETKESIEWGLETPGKLTQASISEGSFFTPSFASPLPTKQGYVQENPTDAFTITPLVNRKEEKNSPDPVMLDVPLQSLQFSDRFSDSFVSAPSAPSTAEPGPLWRDNNTATPNLLPTGLSTSGENMASDPFASSTPDSSVIMQSSFVADFGGGEDKNEHVNVEEESTAMLTTLQFAPFRNVSALLPPSEDPSTATASPSSRPHTTTSSATAAMDSRSSTPKAAHMIDEAKGSTTLGSCAAGKWSSFSTADAKPSHSEDLDLQARSTSRTSTMQGDHEPSSKQETSLLREQDERELEREKGELLPSRNEIQSVISEAVVAKGIHEQVAPVVAIGETQHTVEEDLSDWLDDSGNLRAARDAPYNTGDVDSSATAAIAMLSAKTTLACTGDLLGPRGPSVQGCDRLCLAEVEGEGAEGASAGEESEDDEGKLVQAVTYSIESGKGIPSAKVLDIHTTANEADGSRLEETNTGIAIEQSDQEGEVSTLRMVKAEQSLSDSPASLSRIMGKEGRMLFFLYHGPYFHPFNYFSRHPWVDLLFIENRAALEAVKGMEIGKGAAPDTLGVGLYVCEYVTAVIEGNSDSSCATIRYELHVVHKQC